MTFGRRKIAALAVGAVAVAGMGAGAVAAPLFDFDNRPAAVVSVCGPADRIQANVDRLAEALLAETHRLSTRLGHRPTS